MIEQQAQEQLQASQQSLDLQAAQILRSMGSADLASLLNRPDLTAPIQSGAEGAALPSGEHGFLPQQQQPSQQMHAPPQVMQIHYVLL